MSTQGIAIDLEAVTALFQALSSDVDAGLVPDGDRAAAGIGAGARFGAGFDGLPGVSEVKAGATLFARGTGLYTGNLAKHVANARQQVAAIEQILRNYRGVDEVGASLASAAMTRTGQYSDESTSASSIAVPSGVAETLKPPPLPRPPSQAAECLAWGDAFDVPRMMSILYRDHLADAWEQVAAVRLLGQALEGHYRRILAIRPKLADSWPTSHSTTAAQAQTKLDAHAKAVWQDAVCAQNTARALDGIVSALEQARAKMLPLHEDWQRVTTDFVPEQFDGRAADLNESGRQIMVELENAVRDHRTQIYWPESIVDVRTQNPEKIGQISSEPAVTTGSSTTTSNETSSSSVQRPVPPIPGASPVDGPGLAGGKPPVGVSPDTPPSTLPIPPGRYPGLPNGGAWVLPGPTVGTVARVLPAPGRTTGTGMGTSTGTAGSVRGGTAGATGMMGYPMAGGYGAPGSAGSPARQRMGTEQWEVAKGVPPQIGDTGPFFEEEPDPEAERARAAIDDFEDWYANVAMPWNTSGTK